MAHLHALPIGHELHGYRIERVLGAGGFGITYLASEPMIGRQVAIKEFLPGSIAARDAGTLAVRPLLPADEETFRWGLKRFRNEARTLVSFRHPNIVQVYRFFEANGTAYLVMAYEKGASLAEILKAQRTLSEAELSALLDPLLDGIARVHAAGFLHRDIKPANIVVRADGSPALIDFGAARQSFGEKSHSSRAIVSPGYAPFEQYASSAEQGPWTDLYALGATLYCCVTGTRPVEAPDRVAGAPMRAAAELADGRYASALLRAIDWALAIQPESRPRSVEAWRAALAAPAAPAAAGEPTEPPHEPTTLPPVAVAPPPARAERHVTRRAAQFGLLAAGAAAVLGGGYGLVRAHVAAERAKAEEEGRRRAQAEQDRRRRQEDAARAEAERSRVEAARARAEEAATKGFEAQRRAQAEARAAQAAKQQALSAQECGRRAAGRARNGTSGHYQGKLTDGTEYEGQVNAQKLIDGCGIKIMPDKRRFEGQMNAGKVHGYVVFLGNDGSRFEGAYSANDVNGYGVYRYPQGHELQGKFVGLMVDGPAVWIQTNGTRYEGEMRRSRWWGFGATREPNGDVYAGEFIDGMRHGLGVHTAAAGGKTFGRWEKGEYKGIE
ncbi:MAG: protein kinase [Candidatus Odyssella sp.]|nr:protein kinase [Candidatus Odyssella sp.]